MNSVQLENLDKSLRKAFSSVARDVERLKGRDNIIREEVAKLADKLDGQVSKDDFYKIVQRIDETLKDSISSEDIKSIEDRILKSTQKIVETPTKKISSIEKDFKNLDDENKLFKKEIDEEIKSINEEFANTENLKKEVKEVSKIKKSLLNLDERYAQNKKLDTCFEEIDEIYDLVEGFEKRFTSYENLEKFKKEISEKLNKFEKRIRDAEDVENELIKKTKDIYSLEKNVEQLRKQQNVMEDNISNIDNKNEIEKLSISIDKDFSKRDLKINAQKELIQELKNQSKRFEKSVFDAENKFLNTKSEISEVNLALLKEISKLETRLARESEQRREMSDKLNDLIKLVNKESEIKTRKLSTKAANYYEDESRELKNKINKLEKKISKNKSIETTNSSIEQKTMWMKIVDWFTEDVDDSTTNNENKKIQPAAKSKPKPVKKEITKRTTKNKTSDEELKKSVWKRVMDWLTEEIEEDSSSKPKSKSESTQIIEKSTSKKNDRSTSVKKNRNNKNNSHPKNSNNKSVSENNNEKKTVWMKIADWFTEEVEEENEKK